MAIDDARYVGSICMLVLSLAGISLVWLNSLSKQSTTRKDVVLTRLFWKFDPISREDVFVKEQRVSFYKIFCAGIMLNSVFVAILLKLVSVNSSLKAGGFFFIIWVSALLFFWRLYIQSVPVTENKPDPKSNFIYEDKSDRLRVSIVTGFLGSGKTTLVKRILNNTIGMKILVIENEIGSEGIDHDLLLQSTEKENIVLLNNGCICCTVRSDLLSTFRQLFQNDAFSKIDWIIIETTGLADPAPLIQSFYMDSECQKKLVIDGVITVVDSKHLPLHLKEKGSEGDIRGAHGEISEAVKQISYADRILLNKIDLVGVNEIVSLKKSVSQLNAAAVVYECVKANVNIQDLLNIKAFDPSKFTSLNYGDLNNQSTILIERDSDGKILKKKGLLDLRKKLTPSTKGNRNIATYSMIAEEAIDLAKFNLWIADLMQTRGADIFRMKGILNISGYDERFIFHGVHMVFDGTRGEKWGVEKRRSKMVVIGMGLLKEELEVGFTTTIA